MHGRGEKRVSMDNISQAQVLEPFRWITVGLRAMTHDQQKAGILSKKEPQKVSKKLVKNGVPEPPYPIP